MRWVSVVAVVWVLGILAPGVAYAGKYKVTIDTEPEGATVYFDSTETTPVCEKTPCTVDVPAQETVVYIQLKNYEPELDSVDPAKKNQKIKKIMKPATGTIVINDAKGSRVTIDDEDKGKAPGRFELGEGAHHVVVTSANNKVLFEDFVEVKVGEDATVDVGEGGGGGDVKKPPDDGKVVTPGPATAHRRWIVGSVAGDLGFRSFTYTNNKTMNTLRDVSESGEFLLGPVVEVWPMAILGIDRASGLSVMAKVQFHLNGQAVDSNDTRSLKTFWRDIEAIARYRWVFADAVGVEALAGYGRDTYRFSGVQSEIDLVPDADYQSVRLGARVSATALADGKVEPYLEIENRIVVSGGALDSRFTGSASASGFHGGVGVLAHVGKLTARAEAGLSYYTWTFKADSPTDTRIADGATDTITQVSLSLGYAY